MHVSGISHGEKVTNDNDDVTFGGNVIFPKVG